MKRPGDTRPTVSPTMASSPVMVAAWVVLLAVETLHALQGRRMFYRPVVVELTVVFVLENSVLSPVLATFLVKMAVLRVTTLTYTLVVVVCP